MTSSFKEGCIAHVRGQLKSDSPYTALGSHNIKHKEFLDGWDFAHNFTECLDAHLIVQKEQILAAKLTDTNSG